MSKQKITALYERLSRDDELQGESNSMLLAVRIEKRPFNACVLWLHLLPTLRLRSCFSLWQSS